MTILVAGAAALFVALFFPILALRWRFYDEQPRYSHCPMLPVVAGFWIWDRWERIRAVPRGASRAGVALVVASVVAYLYGRRESVNLVQHVAMLLTLVGGVWAMCGGRMLRALAFPLGYLFLTVPLPKTWDDAITQPLQRMATMVAEGAFDAFGWIVVRQGNVLQLPGLKLLVEDACSGVHSLYSLVALGIAWVGFTERPRWLRAVLVVSTVPVALAANSLRVIATGVLAYKVDPSYAVGTSHAMTGVIVFVTGLVLFLFVDWALRPDDPEPEAPERDGADRG